MRTRICCAVAALVALTSICRAAELPKDPALERKVSLTMRQGRLHQALEQLASQAHVSLYSGHNDQDWRVRDIPVTVSAHDVPVGRVLSGLAEATHLYLSSTKTSTGYAYRLTMDFRREKQIQNYVQRLKDAHLAAALYSWDALSAVTDLPREDVGKMDPGSYQVARAMSGVLSQLGQNGKDQLVSAGFIRLDTSKTEGPLKSRLNDLAAAYAAQCGSPPTEDVLNSFRLSMTLDDPNSIVEVMFLNRNTPGYQMNLNTIGAESVKKEALQKLGLAPPPALPSPPDQTPQGYEPLTETVASMPALQTAVTLKTPKDAGILKAADLLTALGAASGWTIICEDFETQRRYYITNGLFAKDITLARALHTLTRPDPQSSMGFNWYVDATHKTILGMAVGWPLDHLALVPESLLSHLRDKLNTDGVDLDDYLPVWFMPQDQRGFWIDQNDNLRVLVAADGARPSEWWRLDRSLKPEDKKQARSGAGLPLSSIDPAFLSTVAGEQAEQDKKDRDFLDFVLFRNWQPPAGPPPNPDAYAKLTLFVQKTLETLPRPVDMPTGTAETRTEYRPHQGYAYKLVIVGDIEGKPVRYAIDGPANMPVYSPKREAELATEKSHKGTPK